MTRRATVTKAQLRRVLDVLEERGRTVAEVIEAHGEIRMRLTDGTDADLPSADQAEAEWDKALGLQS